MVDLKVAHANGPCQSCLIKLYQTIRIPVFRLTDLPSTKGVNKCNPFRPVDCNIAGPVDGIQVKIIHIKLQQSLVNGLIKSSIRHFVKTHLRRDKKFFPGNSAFFNCRPKSAQPSVILCGIKISKSGINCFQNQIRLCTNIIRFFCYVFNTEPQNRHFHTICKGNSGIR